MFSIAQRRLFGTNIFQYRLLSTSIVQQQKKSNKSNNSEYSNIPTFIKNNFKWIAILGGVLTYDTIYFHNKTDFSNKKYLRYESTFYDDIMNGCRKIKNAILINKIQREIVCFDYNIDNLTRLNYDKSPHLPRIDPNKFLNHFPISDNMFYKLLNFGLCRSNWMVEQYIIEDKNSCLMGLTKKQKAILKSNDLFDDSGYLHLLNYELSRRIPRTYVINELIDFRI